MNKKLLFLVVFVSFLSVANLVSAGIMFLNPLCLNPGPNCIDSFPKLLTKITDYIFGIIAVLATLMFVISGIFFVTSAGNPERITRAKNIAFYAVIGAAIALAGKGLIEVIKAVIGAPP